MRLDTAGNTKRLQSEMRREPQNSSIPVPRFRSGSGMLNHTGGTYSHNVVIDYPRFPIAEIHLGKFPDSVEFGSWKVNIKTEVCSKTADPHLTMHWIKEVEIAKSIDELVTSRSTVARSDFPDYDDCVSVVKASRQSFALPMKSKCRRAACSKKRPISTREANCMDNL